MKMNHLQFSIENLITSYTQVIFDELIIRVNNTITKASVISLINLPYEKFYKGLEEIIVFGIFNCYGFLN